MGASAPRRNRVVRRSIRPAAAALALAGAMVGINPAAAHTAGPPRSTSESFLQFAMTSERTRDMSGVEPSLYRGTFYRPSVEAKRRCIVRRESNGHYFSISRSGYRGAYQLSSALARGVTWMMLPEHRRILGDDLARQVLGDLRRTPVNRWPRYWQDAAFSTIHNWEYTGSGAAHWRGGRWHC
ncbi:MAG: hypothetical protein KGP12_05420 [Actinomycetales bacterium]|nr:hypothetical protein [Actinomycetales bacterium]